MLIIEQDILRCLTNFNLFNPDDFRRDVEIYSIMMTNNKISNYLKEGWREKLLATFCIVFNRKVEFLNLIIDMLFAEVDGKQIKGYILAVLVMKDKDESIELFTRYLREYQDISMENKWIFQALECLEYRRADIKWAEGENKMNNYLKFLRAK
ncbi:MAG: hypothetical protein JO154_22615 [Chitinophaga sp.]|uniref:DUF6000 family protein n=1 Tax=Chitinophaga sp. TaxID=1869181 RepID=UPI0025BC4E7E|nr:DUF6000 family protein [Chitinophaga sp.]MBV8255411.1 hypothetical protein [Chitinophaga sp.]